MTWSVEWQADAEKQLATLDKTMRRRVLTAVGKLADNPKPPGCRLVISQGVWRIRVGDYRIKYEVEDRRLVVVVVEVVHRGRAY